MRTKVFIIALTLLFSTMLLPISYNAQTEDVLYAEVHLLDRLNNMETSYVKISGNRALLSIKNTKYRVAEVVLDPRLGLRIKDILFNGKILPHNSTLLKAGIYEVTLFVEDIGYGDYEIIFENYISIPSAYVLFISDNYTKIEGNKVMVKSQDKWQPYAVFAYVLTTLNGVEPEIVTDSFYSLISERIVEYETPLGTSKGKELIYYVQDNSFIVRGGIISLACKPIYVYEIFPQVYGNYIEYTEIDDLDGINGTYYLLVFKPEYFQLIGVIGVSDATLPYNLSSNTQLVYKIINKENVVVKYELKEVKMLFSCKTSCPSSLKGLVKAGEKVREYEITGSILSLKPSLNTPVTVTIYFENNKVKDFRIFSFHDYMMLELPLSLVTVYVTDIENKPLKSGTLIIYSLSTAEKVEYPIETGEISLGFLPEGDYLARVIVDDFEVGREMFNPTDANELRIACKVADLKIHVKDLNMQAIKDAIVVLEDSKKYQQVTNKDGLAFFSQLPLKKYNIKIFYENREVYDGILDFSSQTEAKIVVEAKTLIIKLLNSLGNPIPNVEVTLELQGDGWSKTVLTDEKGRAVFSFVPLGKYVIKYNIGINYRCEKEIVLSKEQPDLITIENDVIFTIFDYAVNANILVIFIFLVLTIAVSIKFLKKGGEIEISRE